MTTFAKTLKHSGQFLAAGLVALVGLAVGATAIGHAIDPEDVGLWTGPDSLFFGTLDGSMHAHQLPGSTLYVVSVMVVVLCFLVARELLGYARAGLGRRAR